jgi:hypothetical protein
VKTNIFFFTHAQEVIWALATRVQRIGYVTAVRQDVSEELSTHVAVVHSTRGSPDILTSLTSPISLPNTISSFLTLNGRPQLFSLQMQPVFTNVYATFWSNSQLEEPFRTFFWIATEQVRHISLIETPEHKTLFTGESPCYVCAVL